MLTTKVETDDDSWTIRAANERKKDKSTSRHACTREGCTKVYSTPHHLKVIYLFNQYMNYCESVNKQLINHSYLLYFTSGQIYFTWYYVIFMPSTKKNFRLNAKYLNFYLISHVTDRDQHLERPIYRNFEISNIKGVVRYFFFIFYFFFNFILMYNILRACEIPRSVSKTVNNFFHYGVHLRPKKKQHVHRRWCP